MQVPRNAGGEALAEGAGELAGPALVEAGCADAEELATISVSLEEEHTDTKEQKEQHPSSALGNLIFGGTALAQARAAGLAPFTTMAEQTGTMHGVGGDSDWSIHLRTSLILQGINTTLTRQGEAPVYAGTDQHGTSTIPDSDFWNMPLVPVLSDHLATEYQRYLFRLIAQHKPDLTRQFGLFYEAILYPDRPIPTPALQALVGDAVPQSDKNIAKFRAAWEAAMADHGVAPGSHGDDWQRYSGATLYRNAQLVLSAPTVLDEPSRRRRCRGALAARARRRRSALSER